MPDQLATLAPEELAERFHQMCNDLAPEFLDTHPDLLVTWDNHNPKCKALLIEAFRRLKLQPAT